MACEKMETNHEHFINRQRKTQDQRGNALIYVLIAVALFAALSFTMSRQTDSNEAQVISDDQAELLATQIISYTVQAKSVIDQMIFTGSDINDLDFIQPTDANFDTGSDIHKVYHPQGGGLNPGRLPTQAIDQNSTDPVAGWYMGRFNSVEWTPTAANDVILVAYQISQQVCEKLNYKITGSTAIPTLGDSIKELLIDDAQYGAGVNLAVFLTDPTGAPHCGDCHKLGSMCVENQSQNAYGFYTILADQ